MSVNPSELKLFTELEKQAQQNPDVGEMTIEKFRELSKTFAQYSGEGAKISFKDMTVPARDGYNIPIRIYNNDLEASSPVLIMYPGCGYLLDLFEVNAVAASRIAKYADIKVIMVNFRLCPDVKMPIPIYDAYDATCYIAQHLQEFKINPKEIYLGGLSSGAHAAANISLMLREEKDFSIKHQFLINGSYDLTQSQKAYKKFELEDRICQRGDTLNFMFENFGVEKQELSNSILSPLFNQDVANIPDTTFLIGEYDGIRSDSEAYYEHLKSCNENVERILLPGQTHNTMIMRGAMTDGEDPALTIANLIKHNLGEI